MKEKIQKLRSIQKEAVDFLKEKKFEEGIAKLEEADTLATEMEAEDTKEEETAEDVKKTAEIAVEKAVEEAVKKYASLSVSREEMSDLLEDLLKLSPAYVQMVDRVQKLEGVEKQSTQIQEKVEKTGDVFSGIFG